MDCTGKEACLRKTGGRFLRLEGNKSEKIIECENLVLSWLVCSETRVRCFRRVKKALEGNTNDCLGDSSL